MIRSKQVTTGSCQPQTQTHTLFFVWWGLLHGPQQGPDRMKEKTYKTGKRKFLPKQKNPP
jgi:hypothetical protein